MVDNNESPGGHYETEVTYEVIETGSSRRRLLAAVLVILVVLLAVAGVFVWRNSQPAGAPAGVTDDGMEWVRSVYAWGKTPAELLQAPVDVAVGPDGTIWTVSGKTTLVGFSPDGTLRRLVPFERGGEQGQVMSIEGMDVGDDGTLYLADFGQNSIHVVSPEGEILDSFGVQLPVEVAVRGDRLAVAASNGIAVMTTTGELVSQWGSRGNAPDQVDLPHGIVWADDETILVSDTHNRRIKAYFPDGRLRYIAPESMETAPDAGVQAMESKESTLTPYQLPSGMTLDAAGRVLLVDPFAFAVMAVDPATGALSDTWGDFGAVDGSFAYPTGIDYDAERDYYVIADTANNRLQVVELPGSGGAALAEVRRAVDGPVWLCAIPLILLIIAIVLWISKRRRGAERTDGQRDTEGA
ncbi:MAG: NHL repeat-containing protein [Coriobacteriia bacterium]|nr:NHL repeat-containing protein [Coriobacteriia bacterium]MBN2839614.1 NHL repeat-containing protein [Coriobacteriia bacterium]